MKLGCFLYLLVALSSVSKAANPFLDAVDDKPRAAIFRGDEWGDNIGEDEISLSARVVITRVAKMDWGSIFKIDFADIKSHAPEPRRIESEYFIATDDRIVLINEENNEDAVKKISAMDQPPDFEQGNIYGITSGTFEYKEGLWTTTIELKGDQCIYSSNHPSGHFKKVVWRRGVGLIEYSMGYGAMKDGFRLRRTSAAAAH